MDMLIIGAGPAGISAAIYAARAGLSPLVLYMDDGALQRAKSVENYFGLAEPVSGAELLARGKAGALRLGVQFKESQVFDLQYDGALAVTTSTEVYHAQTVILATGAARTMPTVPGLNVLLGHGVSFCAVCDAFFYRGKHVAVIGSGAYALHEAEILSRVAASVTILTDKKKQTVEFPEKYTVYTEKVSCVRGTTAIDCIILYGGKMLFVDGIFIAVGVAGSAELAAKVGAFTKDGKILTDADRMTNVPGLYAAGDCTGGLLQISKAVADGALAATAAVERLRREN